MIWFLLTGVLQPDRRNVNSNAALDTNPRTALLSSFTGVNGNGGSTLFVSDASAVGTGTFASWSLELTQVPEPGTGVLLLLGLAVCGGRRSERVHGTNL